MVLTERAREIRNHASMAGAVGTGLAGFEILMSYWKENFLDQPNWWWLAAVLSIFSLVFVVVVAIELYLDSRPVRLAAIGEISGWWLNRVYEVPGPNLKGCSAVEINGTRETGFQIKGYFLGTDQRQGGFRGRGSASSDDSICFHYTGDELDNPDHGPCFYQFYKFGPELRLKGGFHGLGLHEARRVEGRRATRLETEMLSGGRILELLGRNTREYPAEAAGEPVTEAGRISLAWLFGTGVVILVAFFGLTVYWGWHSRVGDTQSRLAVLDAQVAHAKQEIAEAEARRLAAAQQIAWQAAAGLKEEWQRRARIRELDRKLDQIYDFTPHIVRVTAVDANTAYKVLAPTAFRILTKAMADASAKLASGSGNTPETGFSSAGYAAEILARVGVPRDPEQLASRSGPPRSGDIVFYPGDYRMFFFRLPGKEFVIGMTPLGVLALDPAFVWPPVRIGALPSLPDGDHHLAADPRRGSRHGR
jgi:hypothetical protein